MAQMKSVPFASVEVIHEKSTDEPIGTLALPIRDHVNAQTMMSLLTTDYSFLGNRRMDRLVVRGSMLPLQRNECVARMRGEWLIFIDDDMTFQPDALGRLVQTFTELHDENPGPLIVGGLCVRRTYPHQPTLYMREQPVSGPWRFLETWDTDLVEVDATGLAFAMIGVEVFEGLLGDKFPPYEARLGMGPAQFFEWTHAVGEDLRFCAEARATGTRIVVDTRIPIGHMGEASYSLVDFHRAVAERTQEEEDAVREVNDRFGLPTLTADEARTRIFGS
jgi:Glycosyl transferase family 2